MPNSGQIYSQIQGTMGELDPLVAAQPGAGDFFKQGLNKAFDFNMPLLKEGAALEAGTWGLPQKLMEQYFAGGGFPVAGGPSGGAAMGSILNRLGTQFGLVDLAKGLAERQGARIDDIAGNLTSQYGLKIQGLKDKLGMLQPLLSTAVGREDAAAARAQQAALARQQSEAQALQFKKLVEDMAGGTGSGAGAGAANYMAQRTAAIPAGQVINPKYAMRSFAPGKQPADFYLPATNTAPKSTLTNQYGFTPGQIKSTPTPVQMKSMPR